MLIELLDILQPECTLNTITTNEFFIDDLTYLHFIDRHCIKLATRLGKHPKLYLKKRLESFEKSCFEINLGFIDFQNLSTLQEVITYKPGIILRWLFKTFTQDTIIKAWNTYLTSKDKAYFPLVGSTLKSNQPHLKLGFVKGVDLFNCGEFYAAHEDWESVWIRLDKGAEKTLLQGLIQLCGAHIHRLKGRDDTCYKMLDKAVINLDIGSSLRIVDTKSLIDCSLDILHLPLEAPINWPSIPLVNVYTNIPRKHQ